MHDIVDTQTHKPLPIDHLVRAGVTIVDVARAYLMIEVYPSVQVHIPNELEASDLRKHAGSRRNKQGEEVKRIRQMYKDDTIILYKISVPPLEIVDVASIPGFVPFSQRKQSSVLNEELHMVTQEPMTSSVAPSSTSNDGPAATQVLLNSKVSCMPPLVTK